MRLKKGPELHDFVVEVVHGPKSVGYRWFSLRSEAREFARTHTNKRVRTFHIAYRLVADSKKKARGK